ncbi:hypothetical protein Tco_0982904 [Tanacetum coccineum]
MAGTVHTSGKARVNVEKLQKMAGVVRTDGKGSVRRKKKAVHKLNIIDDKRLLSTSKRIQEEMMNSQSSLLVKLLKLLMRKDINVARYHCIGSVGEAFWLCNFWNSINPSSMP